MRDIDLPVKHLDGIFSDERVMQFFIALKAIGESCFRTLYDLAQEKSHSVQILGDTPSTLGRSLKRTVCVGLDYVNGWDDSIKDQEVMQAKKQVPTIESDYKYTLVQYLKQMHRHKSSHMRMKIPSFSHFLYSFLRRMANSEELRELQYFSSSFADKDVFMRELLRQTLGQDCAPQAILLEEAPMGEVATSHVSSASSASAGSRHDARSTRGVSLPMTPATPNPLGDVPWEQQSYLQQEVTPDDSISNVPRPKRNVASKAASLASFARGGLTPGVLARHMQRYTSAVTSTSAANDKHASQVLHGGPLHPPSEQRGFQSQMKSIPIGTGAPPAPPAPLAPPAPVPQPVQQEHPIVEQVVTLSQVAPVGALPQHSVFERKAALQNSTHEPSFIWPLEEGEEQGGEDARSQLSAHPTVLSTFPVLALK